MKVYVVYGSMGDEVNETEIFKVFSNAEKAVDYAIEKAVKAFGVYQVDSIDRNCISRGDSIEDYPNDSDYLFGIFDCYGYKVQFFVVEKELEV